MTRAALNYANANPSARGSIGSKSKDNHKQVVAIADPWSPHAKGSKLPDSDSTPSVAVTIKDRSTYNGDANGRMSVAVNPCLFAAYTPTTTTTATNANFDTLGNSAGVTDFTALSAAFDKYRIVSWGIRVYTTLPPLNQSGQIAIITTSQNVTSKTVKFTGSLFEQISRHPVANADIHWIGKPVGNAWLDYSALTDEIAAYETVVVCMDGLDPTITTGGPYVIEVVYNLECQTDQSNITSLMSSPAAPSSPLLIAAGANTHLKRSHTHNGKTSSWTSRLFSFAREALADVASAALPMVGNAVGGLIRNTGRRTAKRIQNAPQFKRLTN